MAGKGVDAAERTRDFLDEQGDHENRIQALESGAHPTRAEMGPGTTTPWFPLDKATGWTGVAYWRLARSIVQMRGEIEGPTLWEDGTIAFFMPPDIIPAWPMDLVVMHSDGKPTRMTFQVDGDVVAYRADDAPDSVVLDAVRFPRG